MPYQSYVLDRRILLAYSLNTADKDNWNQPRTKDVTEEVWAAKRDVTARERIAASDAVISIRSTRFIIRYRDDVQASWTVKHDGLTFRVAGLREVNRKRYLELFCVNISGG